VIIPLFFNPPGPFPDRFESALKGSNSVGGFPDRCYSVATLF
jgi:hypothetical protein